MGKMHPPIARQNRSYKDPSLKAPDRLSAAHFVTSLFTGALISGIAALALPDGARAQSFTVQNGQTVGEQTMNNAGDTGTVESGGTIDSANDGVRMFGDDQQLTNDGRIDADDDGVAVPGENAVIINTGTIEAGKFGIDSSDDGMRVENSGTIRGGNVGIASDGDGTTIVNSGTIAGNDFGTQLDDVASIDNSGTIEGGVDGLRALDIGSLTNSGIIRMLGPFGDDAIVIDGDTGSLVNSGTISGRNNGITTGGNIDNLTNSGTITGNENGIETDGDIGILTNSGVIEGLADNGIEVDENIGILTNSGIIRGVTNAVDAEDVGAFFNSGLVTGNVDVDNLGELRNSGSITSRDDGISVDERLELLVNSGSIVSETAVGIRADEIGSITNSGRISGPNHAIAESRTANTVLTLLGGSVIDGRIDLGGGVNILNVGNGLNLDHTFENAAPVIGTTSGAPFIVTGNTVLVVDPSGPAMPALYLGDLTTSLFNAIDLSPGGEMGQAITTHGAGADMGAKGQPGMAASGRMRAWLSGFGRQGRHDADGPFTDIDSSLIGALAGFENGNMDSGIYGLFGGVATAQLDSDFNAWGAETSSLLGGVYWKQDYGSLRIHATLTAGMAEFDWQRRVANNLVPGGIENGKADEDGWFVSPSLSLAAPIAGTGLEAGLRLTHASLFLDGYRETGTTNPLTVSSRAIHQFQGRAQLALPTVIFNGDGSHTHIEWRTGVDGRFDTGSENVSATLAGVPLGFSAMPDDQISGFAGVSLARENADGSRRLEVGLELQSGFSGGYQAGGSLKYSMRF